ncbi:hypothetical protein [Metapseudomonas otitidis]
MNSALDGHATGNLAIRPFAPPAPFRQVAIDVLADSVRLCSVRPA